MAINKLNLNYEVEAIQYDSDSLSDDIDSKGLDLLIGPFLSKELMTIYDEVKELNIPVFVGTATTNYLNGKMDNYFRLTYSNTSFAELIHEDLQEKEAGQTLFLYDVNNQVFTLEMVELISGHMNEGTYKLLAVDDDYNVSEDIKSYDTLYIVTSPQKAGVLIQKSRQLGFEKTIYLGPWAAGQLLLDYVGDATDNVILHTANYSTKPYYDVFYDNHVSETGSVPPASALYSFEIIHLLNEYSEDVDITSVSELTSYISENQGYEGVLIDALMNEYGDSQGQLYSLIIKDGRITHE
jgi:ABC-type branched-subunit amino acid transport system substrate-binding protein